LAPTLSERAQAWLLNEAAFRLQALGRLNEALEPMRASLEMAEGSKAWEAAAIRASNLSGLELTLGDVFAAVHDAERSVEFADRSKDEFQRMTKRATLADALHQAGRVAEARDRFTEAETMLAKQQPESPLLYSLAGFRYCDLLLSEAECAAWLRFIAPDIVERPQQEACARFASQCREVGQRAAQTLRRAEERGLGLLTPALDHLTLGRAAVYRAVLDVEGPGRAAALQSAREHLDEAVDGLRRASAQDFLPRGLLSRAWLRHIVDDDIAARADLDEAWGVAERGPMRLHMADILLYRARLFHDKAALEGARTLIEKHGYHRRDAELEDAARAARGWQWAITGIRRNVEDRGL
jgi:hypothetical protein